MSADPLPTSMADLPPQMASDPESDAQKRARFFNSGNAFNIKLSEVPNAVFADEPARVALGEQGRRHVAEHFTSDAMALAFEKLCMMVAPCRTSSS